jgi:hypothetical protein
MGIADFLFEGKAPPSVTTYGSSTSNIPAWMEAYNQGLISRANAIAAEPYQAYGGPRIAGFSEDTRNAFNLTRQAANAYQGPLAQALGMTEGAVAPGTGGLAAAQPHLANAAGTYPEAASQYMDPYVQNVINRAKLEANRNYTENILPTLDAKFTQGGQYGSSAMAREANRAARDVTEGVQSQADAALSQAYTTGAGIYGADKQRAMGLAQLTGQLGAQERDSRLKGAAQIGALGQTAQQLGLTGAGALDTVGKMQQGQQQANLDLAYQDFANQRDYPRQTVDWLSSVIRGMPAPVSTTSQQRGPANTYQPSPINQFGSLATGIAGIADLFKGWGGSDSEQITPVKTTVERRP